MCKYNFCFTTFSHCLLCLFHLLLKNAAAEVEKMILGNKCDLDDARVVSTERGRLVSDCYNYLYSVLNSSFILFVYLVLLLMLLGPHHS